MADAEVPVLGAGPAGIAAAASATAGREVLPVERYGFLGGIGTAAGVKTFRGLHVNVHGEMKQVVHGVTDGLLQRIAAQGGRNEPLESFGCTLAQAYDGAANKCAADDLLLARGAKLLFHALAGVEEFQVSSIRTWRAAPLRLRGGAATDGAPWL